MLSKEAHFHNFSYARTLLWIFGKKLSNGFLLFEQIADNCIASYYKLQVYSSAPHKQNCTVKMKGIEISGSLREEATEKNITIGNE